MPGETNLTHLLRTMEPILVPGEYVFCTVDPQKIALHTLNPLGLFQEAEGMTLILERKEADTMGLSYGGVFALITLSIHSSLEAIGFLAVITQELAAHHIAVNAVSAYYHDHLFVPADRGLEALGVLQALACSQPTP